MLLQMGREVQSTLLIGGEGWAGLVPGPSPQPPSATPTPHPGYQNPWMLKSLI